MTCRRCQCVELVVMIVTPRKTLESDAGCASYDPKQNLYAKGSVSNIGSIYHCFVEAGIYGTVTQAESL